MDLEKAGLRIEDGEWLKIFLFSLFSPFFSQANCGPSFSSLQSQRELASGLGELWFGVISKESTTESSREAHLVKSVSMNRLTGLSWFWAASELDGQSIALK